VNHLLALYGAKELFGQLADMEPRPKRTGKRRAPPRARQNGDDSDSDKEGSETAASSGEEAPGPDSLLSLYGASELYAQLARDQPKERKPWSRNRAFEDEPAMASLLQ